MGPRNIMVFGGLIYPRCVHTELCKLCVYKVTLCVPYVFDGSLHLRRCRGFLSTIEHVLRYTYSFCVTLYTDPTVQETVLWGNQILVQQIRFATSKPAYISPTHAEVIFTAGAANQRVVLNVSRPSLITRYANSQEQSGDTFFLNSPLTSR